MTPSVPPVGLSVGLGLGLSVIRSLPKGREVTLPCSYRGTNYICLSIVCYLPGGTGSLYVVPLHQLGVVALPFLPLALPLLALPTDGRRQVGGLLVGTGRHLPAAAGAVGGGRRQLLLLSGGLRLHLLAQQRDVLD